MLRRLFGTVCISVLEAQKGQVSEDAWNWWPKKTSGQRFCHQAEPWWHRSCVSERTCEPSTWGFRRRDKGRLKKKEEKGTERGKEHVDVILSDQHGCFVYMCTYLPWSRSAKDQRCRAESISMTPVIPLVLAQSQPSLSLWWHSKAFPLSALE